MVELPRSDVPGRTAGQPSAPGVSTQVPPGRGNPRSRDSMFVEEGFSGWAWFTGGLMGLVGLFQLMAGLVELAGGSGYYTTPSRSLVVDVSYSTWGWAHLILGILGLAIGGGVAFGNSVARVAGIVLTGLSAIVNLLFIPAAPVASTLIIALNVFLIYALTVHGGEPKRAR